MFADSAVVVFGDLRVKLDFCQNSLPDGHVSFFSEVSASNQMHI